MASITKRESDLIVIIKSGASIKGFAVFGVSKDDQIIGKFTAILAKYCCGSIICIIDEVIN